jgi:hypothetical protein
LDQQPASLDSAIQAETSGITPQNKAITAEQILIHEFEAALKN